MGTSFTPMEPIYIMHLYIILDSCEVWCIKAHIHVSMTISDFNVDQICQIEINFFLSSQYRWRIEPSLGINLQETCMKMPDTKLWFQHELVTSSQFPHSVAQSKSHTHTHIVHSLGFFY